MIGELKDLVLSYLLISEVYHLVKHKLYKTHNVINYSDLDLSKIIVNDPQIQDHISIDVYKKCGGMNLSSIRYKEKHLYIQGPKLYTKTGISETERQYSFYEYMLAIKTVLDKNLDDTNAFINFLDQLHHRLYTLSESYMEKYNSEFPKEMLYRLFYKLYLPFRHEVTKRQICNDKFQFYLHLDNTIFFDLSGKQYIISELEGIKLWYIPIFEVRYIYFSGQTEIIIGLKYAIIFKDLLISAHCDLEDIYKYISKDLYPVYKIIDYDRINFNKVSITNFKAYRNSDEYEIDENQWLSLHCRLSLIKYNEHQFLIRGPKLYTENGIADPEMQYYPHDGAYTIKSTLNSENKEEKQLWNFFDLYYAKIFELIQPHINELGLHDYSNDMIKRIIPKIYLNIRDDITKQILTTEKIHIFWCLDKTIFFDLKGKIYTREELKNCAFWYIPIFHIRSIYVADINNANSLISLKYVVVLEKVYKN